MKPCWPFLTINCGAATRVDELTEAQVKELQRDLETLCESLQETILSSARGAETVDLDKPIGRLSRMDQLQHQQMAKAQIRRAEQRLVQAKTALEDIAAEDYGFCVRCDEPIGYKRLKARPEAKLCMACLSEAE